MNYSVDTPAQAHRLWLNYYYDNNSMNISPSVMGKIEALYGSESDYNYIKIWEANAETDKTEYLISDDDMSFYNEKGQAKGKNATGYENSGSDKAKQWGNVIGDGVAIGGTVGAQAAADIAKITAKKAAESAAKKAAKSAAAAALPNAGKGAKIVAEGDKLLSEKAAETASKASKTADLSLIAACAMNAAIGAAALLKEANKEQAEALEILQGEMAQANSQTIQEQNNMKKMAEELRQASDEASEANENANDRIVEEKSKNELYKVAYDELVAKNEAAKNGGEPLTDEEQEMLAQLVEYMTATNANMENIQNENAAILKDVNEDMGTYQQGYDDSAKVLGEIDGLTEYAEKFDESTKVAATLEGVLQGVNVADAGVNLTRALFRMGSLGWTGWGAVAYGAAAAAALAGGGMSTKEAVNQFNYAKIAGEEIKLRDNTQSSNEVSKENLKKHLTDDLAGNIETVNNLYLEMPDEVEAPEMVEIAKADPELQKKKDEEV